MGPICSMGMTWVMLGRGSRLKLTMSTYRPHVRQNPPSATPRLTWSDQWVRSSCLTWVMSTAPSPKHGPGHPA